MMQKWLLVLCLLALSACASFNEVDKERFQVNSDETVLDTKTELMWATLDNRQSVSWIEAEEYCNTYKGGGYEDWRMPKKSELAGLIEARIKKEGEIISLSSNLIWAIETEDSRGAYCDFKMRGCSWMEKAVTITLHALPVRDIKTTATTALPNAVTPQSVEQRLQMIDHLHRQQLITTEEYDRKKAAILDELYPHFLHQLPDNLSRH